MIFIFFLLGAAFGSFLNVVAERYNPDKFLLNSGGISGRSFCPKCRQHLRWFELIPLISFLIQGGRCRSCHQKISFQYPFVEIITGLIFVLAFLKLSSALSILWILIFSTLLLVSLIDYRLHLIPDEANIFLIFLGTVLILSNLPSFGPTSGSFLGSYALLFGFRENIWFNHVLAALFALIVFFVLILLTRGRGMGMGDLKLAAALGFLFGWPDIILLFVFAFIIGGVWGLGSIFLRKKGMKSYLPFGPFLAAAGLIVFFWGYWIVDWYFRFFF